MDAFSVLTAQVVPLDRANVDTDAMIPKQFLKSIHRSGFGRYLFDEWRYLDRGVPDMDCTQRPRNPDFVLNQPGYADARILLARANFGCGSSREHAVWALADYGLRVVIAPSFADIFFNNCYKNGVLPVVLDAAVVDDLFAAVAPGFQLTVDLSAQVVIMPDGQRLAFAVEAERKRRLLEGLDDIGITLQFADDIRRYEARRANLAPWLFPPA